jgi:hypothetical protein
MRADAVDCGNGRACGAGLVCVGANECLSHAEIDRRAGAAAAARDRAAAAAEAQRRAAAAAEAQRRAVAEAQREKEKTVVGRITKHIQELATAFRSLPDLAQAGILIGTPLLVLALIAVVVRLRTSQSVLAENTQSEPARVFHASPAQPEFPQAASGAAQGQAPILSTSIARRDTTQELTMSDTDLRSPGSRFETQPLVRVTGIDIHGTYATARSIAALFGLVGWVLVVVGALIALGGLSGGPQGFGMVLVPIGVCIAALGLLQVAAQQILRASVDSADYSRQSFLLQVGLAEGRTEIDVQRPSTQRTR